MRELLQVRAGRFTRGLIALLLIPIFVAGNAHAAPRKDKRASPKAASDSVNSKAGEKIEKVDVRGNQKIDREAILEKIGSKAGQTVDEERIRKDIVDRKSTRLNSSHSQQSRMPSSA